ncbi:MAG: LPS export ABC transporter periplasmic protein LptC [Deltaproteobacteria bacterium]|nr:LPS export ABC transporter periplasmic protein LptC [Deltaproteobacteria bacterium]
MKFKKRIVVITGVIILVISVAAIVLVMESRKSSPIPLLNIMSDKVDLQVKNINYTDVGDSGLKWEIKADSAKYIKSENLAMFDRVRVKLLMSDGKTIVMTGDKGTLNTNTKDMEITGNVEVVSDRGDRLTTDILKYSGSERRIYSEVAVTMENARMQVRGMGMSLSLEDKDVALLSRVRANVK